MQLVTMFTCVCLYMSGTEADMNMCYTTEYIHSYKNTSFFYIPIFNNSNFIPHHDQGSITLNIKTELQFQYNANTEIYN